MSQRGTLLVLVSVSFALLLSFWQPATAQSYMMSTTTYPYTSVKMSSSTALLASECEFFPRPYTDDMVTVDQSVTQIHLEFSSDYPVDLYVMNSSQLQSFVAGSCGNFYATNSQYAAQEVSSLNLNWTPPAQGDYFIVVYNRSTLPINVSLTVALIGLTQETIVSYLTQTITPSSILSTFLQNTEPVTSHETYVESVLLLALLAIIVVALLLILRYRRGRRRRGTELYLEDRQWGKNESPQISKTGEGTVLFKNEDKDRA